LATEPLWTLREEIHALRLPGFDASAFGLDIVSLNLGRPTCSQSEAVKTMFLYPVSYYT